MEKLIDKFLIILYHMIFEEDPHFMSHEAMEALAEISDWFSSPDGTYLKVLDYQKLSHLLSRYSTNKLVMHEVAYHLSIYL